ncbi:hypothetical protein CL657_04010 [bacterium]|nr:hypothetical protein [bacterium]|tara:strand:- start:128 stop:1042 length:915 start_codon:yes stop_codon:yes gene_type:complete
MFLIIYLITTLSSSFATSQRYNQAPNYKSKEFDTKLLSLYTLDPSDSLKKRPVFITVHGFGASPIEWHDFSEYITTHTEALVSNVSLGGHDSVKAFSESCWEDWLSPLCREYQRLVNLGFESIYLCGCSTGATLIIQGLLNNCFRPALPLKHIFLVDALVIPKEPLLYWLPVINYALYDQWLTLSSEEAPYWLPVRPKKALLQLLQLVKKTTHDLKQGISFASHINMSLFQSQEDPIIHPKSKEMLYHGLSALTSRSVHCFDIESDLHVFTRLSKRSSINPKDIDNQTIFFNHVQDVIKTTTTA